MVTAVNQLNMSEIKITINRERQYSPVLSSDVPMAAKPATATTVAPNNGMAVWPTMSLAAFMASMPCCMRIRMPSVTTMALSTSIPRAITSAPNEMRSRVMLPIFIKINVPKMVTAKIAPMIRPLRKPMETNSTSTTIAMEASRFCLKPSMAKVTAWDCSEMMLMSMPTGVSGIRARSLSSMPWPMVTTLPPDTVEIPMPMAGTPLCFRMAVGGS